MTPLTVRLKQYIAMRRSLGFDLLFAERVLRKFAEFADREGADHITVDLFLRWKEHYGSANNLTWTTRLSMVRVFAGWLQGFDAADRSSAARPDNQQTAPDAALHLYATIRSPRS